MIRPKLKRNFSMRSGFSVKISWICYFPRSGFSVKKIGIGPNSNCKSGSGPEFGTIWNLIAKLTTRHLNTFNAKNTNSLRNQFGWEWYYFFLILFWLQLNADTSFCLISIWKLNNYSNFRRKSGNYFNVKIFKTLDQSLSGN